MLNVITDKVRFLVHHALTSTSGDAFTPVKRVRAALSTANDLAGRPFCSAEELASRRYRPSAHGAAQATREPAPVVLYVDGRDQRTPKKIEELLSSRDIPYRVLDVSDDEATRSWATTQAKQDEFPLVFIAGEAIGGLHELTQANVNGTLKKKVFGA
jgi:glutaredoxin-related protein